MKSCLNFKAHYCFVAGIRLDYQQIFFITHKLFRKIIKVTPKGKIHWGQEANPEVKWDLGSL